MNKILLSRSKAKIGEFKVLIEAYNKNYAISKPLSEESRYDFILESTTGELLRTQVKYLTRKKNGTNNLELLISRKKGGKLKGKVYSDKEIDLLLIYIPCVDSIICLTSQYFNNKKSITINMEDENSDNYYKKFLW